MDSSAAYKEQMIREYIMKINWTKDFSIKVIKDDLRRIIKEIPGIDLKWKKEELTTEIKGGKTKIIESVKSINIAFTDGNNPDGSPKIHSVTYYV